MGRVVLSLGRIVEIEWLLKKIGMKMVFVQILVGRTHTRRVTPFRILFFGGGEGGQQWQLLKLLKILLLWQLEGGKFY
jgi:hypothetical protein